MAKEWEMFWINLNYMGLVDGISLYRIGHYSKDMTTVIFSIVHSNQFGIMQVVSTQVF